MDINSIAYKRAFVNYLRRGIPIEVSLKAEQKATAPVHPTTHYIWHTMTDEKVRPSHEANNGRVFAWAEPPPTGHPGEAYGCRCIAEPYYVPDDSFINDPPIDDVYPELIIIPLLKIGRLAIAWQSLVNASNASKNWQLSPTKSATKWKNQIENGNWTPDQITNTIKNGERFKTINERTGGSATRYELGNRYVVRDNKTGNILQISRPNHQAKIIIK